MEWAFTGGGEPEPDVDAIVDGIVNLVQSVSEPADGGDEAAEQGAAEDGAPDQHPVPDEATLAEEPVSPEEPAPAAAPEAPASPESTLVSPAPVPAPGAPAQDEELDEPDDIAAEAQPEPAAPDADLHDQGDWDMDNMPRPRPVR